VKSKFVSLIGYQSGGLWNSKRGTRASCKVWRKQKDLTGSARWEWVSGVGILNTSDEVGGFLRLGGGNDDGLGVSLQDSEPAINV